MKFMNKIDWNSDLETGDKVLDYQHKKIINYLNIIKTTQTYEQVPFSVLRNVINGLIEHTEAHFLDEELVLNAIDYPEIKDHQKEHADFTEQISKFKIRIDNREDVRHELNLYLDNWVAQHVCQKDMSALDLIKLSKR